MKLYEITGAHKQVESMLDDENVDKQMIFDTLESIDGEFDEKIENIVKIIKMKEYERDAKKTEAKKLQDSAKSIDNQINSLKEYAFNGMKTMKKSRVITDLFNISIAKKGGIPTLTIDGEVPEEYTKTIIENDTEKIRQALKDGKELTFAHLEPKRRVFKDWIGDK